jgi:hypothetical protein
MCVLHCSHFNFSPGDKVDGACLQDNTAGTFNEHMYRYGVSPEAQMPRDYEKCYRIGP